MVEGRNGIFTAPQEMDNVNVRNERLNVSDMVQVARRFFQPERGPSSPGQIIQGTDKRATYRRGTEH
jgi:hypothetical protein